MTRYMVRLAEGGEDLLLDGPVDTLEEAQRLADEICEDIRQDAIARWGLNPDEYEYYADDVEIVEIED